MRTIVLGTIFLASALPGIAHAQQPTASPPPGTLAGQTSPVPGAMTGTGNREALLQSPSTAPATGAAGPQKPPRSDKAIGPDLVAYVFAPIGVVVAPIAEGLRSVDAAFAPINEALSPITGPLDPALSRPAGETARPEPAPTRPSASAKAVPTR